MFRSHALTGLSLSLALSSVAAQGVAPATPVDPEANQVRFEVRRVGVYRAPEATRSIEQLRFSPDGSVLACATRRQLTFLDAKVKPLRALSGRRGVAEATAGAKFLLVDKERIQEFDARTGAARDLVEMPQGFDPGLEIHLVPRVFVVPAAGERRFFFPAGSHVDIGEDLWFDPAAGKFGPRMYSDIFFKTRDVALHPKAKTFLVARRHAHFSGTGVDTFGEWRLHDGRSGALRKRVNTEPALGAACYSADGTRIFICKSDGEIDVIDAETGKRKGQHKLPGGPIWLRRLDADHAAVMWDQALRIVTLKDFRVAQTLVLGKLPKIDWSSLSNWSPTPRFALSPDRKTLAIGLGQTLRVYAVTRATK